MRIPPTGPIGPRASQAVAPGHTPQRQPAHRATTPRSAVGHLERQVPPRLGPLPARHPASAAPPRARGPQAALGELSACRDAVDIGDVVRRYPETAVRLVKQTAPELLARIASNQALDADAKLAHLQSLVEFVGRKGGKVDFVTQRGVDQLEGIVRSFKESRGARAHHVAQLLVALQELPKAVSSQQARAMMQQAHGPGWVAPNFGIFEQMHAANHAPGRQGGVYRSDLNAYVYPNGEKFEVRTIREDPVRPPGRFNAFQAAAPLAALAQRQPHQPHQPRHPLQR